MTNTVLLYTYLSLLVILTIIIVFFTTLNYRKIHSKSHKLIIATFLFIYLKFYLEIPFLFGSESLSTEMVIYLYKGGIIAYLLTHLSFGLILLRTGIKGITTKFSYLALVTALISIGMIFTEIIVPDSLHQFHTSNTDLRVDINLIFVITIFLSTFSLIIAFIAMNRLQKSSLTSDEKRKIHIILPLTLAGFIIGSFTRYWLDLSPGISDGTYQLLNVISNLTMALGFLSFSLFLFIEPIFSIYIHKNAKEMLKRGILGWVITSNTDMGPQIRIKSDIFINTNEISESSLFSFTSMSLVLASGSDYFQNKVFSLPYRSVGDYLGICISFTHRDEELTDPRLDHQSFSIFAIFIPESLVSLLSNPIGQMDVLMDLVRKKVETTKDIYEFCELETVEALTSTILDKIL